MDKKELKKILKPLMKECVKELLMEEGMLKVLSEATQPVSSYVAQPQQIRESRSEDELDVKRKIEENRKRMLDEIGRKGYLNGVNPFEGVEALSEGQAPERNPTTVSKAQKLPPVLNSIDPSDPGVNIKGIMNLASGKWKTHMGGKG